MNKQKKKKKTSRKWSDLLGPARGALDTTPQVSRQHQAGDRREEVGRGTEVGCRPDLQEEIQDAGESETGRRGCWKQQ